MSVESPVSFARGLSDPLQPNRLKALKAFNQWMDKFGTSYEFTPKEVDQVWRALQLTLWMADKRPVQQQVAAECVLFARKISPSLLADWNRGFWYNIERIYETIDKHRVAKFHLLIRIYIAELFHQMNSRSFDPEFVQSMVHGITNNVDKALGAYIQLVTVFIDELQIYSDIPETAFLALLDPALQVVRTAAERPLSLISKTVEKILTNPFVINHSAAACSLVKTTVKAAAMSKTLEQDTRDALFQCLDQIDKVPQTLTKLSTIMKTHKVRKSISK